MGMTMAAISISQLAINTIRTLAMDAVQKANSGHPGTPMALAPLAYELWTGHLRYDPRHPHWPARDRFVLSCGHACMLLYSLLHLSGVRRTDECDEAAVTLDDIKNFRQLHSPCAGHPELGLVSGVETTTGPLGQGCANSVGMAIASKWISARYERPGFGGLFANHVFAVLSDGDMMEGVGGEAASLAGHLRLDNLCWIYDDNNITIEGHTDLAFTESVGKRFEALGWRVERISDANDLEAIASALRIAKQKTDRPTLIILKSIIGYGAPKKQNTAAAHGAPLGDDEVAAAKRFHGWPEFEKFLVPEDVISNFSDTIGVKGARSFAEWSDRWEQYSDQFPTESAELKLIWDRKLPAGWEESIRSFDSTGKANATRNWSGKILNAVAGRIPWLIGGSADLAESNKSLIETSDAGHFSAENYAGRNFHFGVREHAMAAICNGLSLSGLRPYAATFFIFTDYLRPALRLSALMGQPVLYIMTHDSIGLGEDGTTHQPVEHLAACRSIPNLLVLRPADGAETAMAYEIAIAQTSRPSMLVLTRQNVPTYDRTKFGSADGVKRGAYILWQPENRCDVILMGSGSEVSICVSAAEKLLEIGIAPRVVSIPSWELFDEQSPEYLESVLPGNCRFRVAVEAGVEMGWQKYLGRSGKFVGMKSFGASAPYEKLYQYFGISTECVVGAARGLLQSHGDAQNTPQSRY
jgi:transketolase